MNELNCHCTVMCLQSLQKAPVWRSPRAWCSFLSLSFQIPATAVCCHAEERIQASQKSPAAMLEPVSTLQLIQNSGDTVTLIIVMNQLHKVFELTIINHHYGYGNRCASIATVRTMN